eukprot:357425-Chlamydomonas_euryale.AAC.10
MARTPEQLQAAGRQALMELCGGFSMQVPSVLCLQRSKESVAGLPQILCVLSVCVDVVLRKMHLYEKGTSLVLRFDPASSRMILLIA